MVDFQQVPPMHHPLGRQRAIARGIFWLTVIAGLLWPLVSRSIAQQQPPDQSVELRPTDTITRPSSPTSEQINAWIDALRHDTYAVRQNAATQLLAAGAAARAPLAAAADSPDPEARAAARRLVTLIEKAEFDRQLAAFAADAGGKQGVTLPGWEQFRQLVGGDVAARALFVEMQRHEAALLADVFATDRRARNPAWEERLLRLLRWPATAGGQPATPPLGTCATMIFLGAVGDGEISERAATYLPLLLQRPPVQPVLVRADRQDPLRRLVVAWVVECPNRSTTVTSKRLELALSLGMREAVPLALDVAQKDPAYLAVHPMVRAQALVLVAQLGSRSDVDSLEPLLEDASVCVAVPQMVAAPRPGQPRPPAREVQIRDLALVAMLQLTEQDPAEYGYRNTRRQSQQLLDPGSVFAENDEVRTSAIAKWHEWKARQGRGRAVQEQVN